MVTGHPFKGKTISTGHLIHPDMKRFNIKASHAFFAPPRPNAYVSGAGMMAVAAPEIPSFGDFFASYFAGRSFNVSDNKCSASLENMKRCYENNSKNPEEACQFYIGSFERSACGAPAAMGMGM